MKTKFVATSRSGETKEFSTYVRACQWLDFIEYHEERTFILKTIKVDEKAQTAWRLVRHA